MNKKFGKALLPLYESTGLDIDIYTGLGDFVFSASGETPCFEFIYHKPEEFCEGILSDVTSGVTYFQIESASEIYIGIILGSNEISKNYAVMVSKIVEGALEAETSQPDIKEKLRKFLVGELNASQMTAVKNNYFNNSFNFYLMSMFTESKAKQAELINLLSFMSDKEDFICVMDSKHLVFIKKCGDEDEYQSANDFAHILYENVKDELRINFRISVGGIVHNFSELPLYYEHSVFTYQLGQLLDEKSNIYSFKEYSIIKLLSDIPKSTLKQHLDTLIDKNYTEILSDSELMDTAEVFLKNSLNISETSRIMYMHRNTLIYRLDKIEKATGLNLRHFNDAMTFRLITVLVKLSAKD